MISMQNFLRRKEGTSAIEFGFTAPIFMLLLWGVVDSGLALWTQFGIQNGAEAAARCATINRATCPDSAAITAYAASNTLGMTVPPTTFTYILTSCGDRVSASYPYAFFTSYLGLPNVTLSAVSCYPDPARCAVNASACSVH